MGELVNQFIFKIGERDPFQRKALEKDEPLIDEKENLEHFLQFCVQQKKNTIDELVEAYLFLINMFREETYYFISNGKYRFSKYEEIGNSVYGNRDYMQKYMIGLAISDYIMIPHLKMIRFFQENVQKLSNGGGKYFEIGPGSGQFLVKAIERGNFTKYKACDLSQTSVNLCNDYLAYSGLIDKCKVECKNFFDYGEEEKYDCIVMGEVLEHVENPSAMLKRIYEMLKDGGKAFITTVINAPAIDHIYLFSTKEEVLNLLENAGFGIEKFILATAGNVPLEKAEKKKFAIDMAMILTK